MTGSIKASHPPLTARRFYFPGRSIAYRAAMCLDYLTAERERQFATPAQHVGSHFLPSRLQVQFASRVSIPIPGGFVCVMLVARISSSSKPFCQGPKFQSTYATTVPADVIKQRARLRDAWLCKQASNGINSVGASSPIGYCNTNPRSSTFPKTASYASPPVQPRNRD